MINPIRNTAFACTEQDQLRLDTLLSPQVTKIFKFPKETLNKIRYTFCPECWEMCLEKKKNVNRPRSCDCQNMSSLTVMDPLDAIASTSKTV